MRFFRFLTVDGLLTASGGATIAGSLTIGVKPQITVTAAGAEAIALGLTNASGSAGSATTIDLDPTGNGVGVRTAQIAATTNGSNAVSLIFRISNGAPPVEGMRLSSSGRLGIGTTAPGSLLDVNGTMNVTGASTHGGVMTVNSTSALNGNVTVAQADARVFVRNTNDTTRRSFIGDTSYAGFLGVNNLTTSVQGRAPASGDTAVLAWDATGKVGSVTNTVWPGAPAYRNVLDDGSGNAIIVGSLAMGTGSTVGGAANNGVNGTLRFDGGASAQAGNIGFLTKEGTRRGYIGWSDGGTNLLLASENGWGWRVFGGALTVDGTLTASGALNVGGGLSVAGASNVAALDTSTRLTLYDSGGRNYWAGIATEAQSQLIDFGINYGQLGNGTNANVQGGMFRVDARAYELFQFVGNPAGGTQSTLASITNVGNLYAKGSATFGGALSVTGSATVTGNLSTTGPIFANGGWQAITPPNSGDITKRIEGGTWNFSGCTKALGWPEDNNSWMHLLTSTHMNTGNYYSMQMAGSFSDQHVYIRKTNGTGTTPWNKLWTNASCPAVIAQSGYRIYPDGIIEQWGFANTDGNGNALLALPVAFPNTLWNIVTSVANQGPFFATAGPSYNASTGYSKSTLQINSWIGTTGAAQPSVTVFWRAIGN